LHGLRRVVVEAERLQTLLQGKRTSSSHASAEASTKAPGPTSKPPSGAKLRGIALAVEAVFPNGVPEGLSKKARDIQINDWLHANGHSRADSRTIRRV
jgi:hypothetical protein